MAENIMVDSNSIFVQPNAVLKSDSDITHNSNQDNGGIINQGNLIAGRYVYITTHGQNSDILQSADASMEAFRFIEIHTTGNSSAIDLSVTFTSDTEVPNIFTDGIDSDITYNALTKGESMGLFTASKNADINVNSDIHDKDVTILGDIETNDSSNLNIGAGVILPEKGNSILFFHQLEAV